MTEELRGLDIPVPLYADLRGKVAVVTGGSKGIGAATCRMLAENAVKVVVVARGEESIAKLVRELHESGAEAIGVSADVTSTAALDHVRGRTEDELGPVDLLMPFAGGFSRFTPVREITEQEWRQVVDDNLTSTFLTIRTFLPGMMERGRGAVVAMSSCSGRYLDKLTTASYAAAKAAVLMFVRHAAIECGPYGVRLNAVAPGTTYSERLQRIMDSEAVEYARRLSPLGRMGMPEDCAAATLFLASESSSWLTGVTVDVSGGRVML